MVEFRDVVKKYASDGEALGVKDSTVDGIPVPSPEDFATAEQGAKADTAVQPDDLGAAATMSPVEVVTDPDAHAALSGAFGLAVSNAESSVVGWDNFDRPDSTSSIGAPPLGAWDVYAGTWGLASGKAYSTTSSPTHRLITMDAGGADHSVEATVRPGPDTIPGLLARMDPSPTPGGTYLYVALRQAAGLVRLTKRTDGLTNTLVDAAYPLHPGADYRIRLVCRGPVIQVYVDGERVLTHTLADGDEVTFASQTRCGLYAGGVDTTSLWDDVVVRDLGKSI